MPISDYTDVTGCQLLLEANRLSAADNDLIATWPDDSGNGRDATTSGTARPTYKTSVVNSQPVLRFDGTGDMFALPNFLTGFTAGEVFVVLKLDADPPGADAQTGLWRMGSAGDATHYPYTDGTIYDGFGATVRKTTVNPTPSLAGAFRTYNVSSASGSWTSRLDGTQIYTTGTNTVGWHTAPLLGTSNGSTYWLDGDLALVVLYNAVLSAGDRSDVYDLIQSTYFGAAAGQPAAKRMGGVTFAHGLRAPQHGRAW